MRTEFLTKKLFKAFEACGGAGIVQKQKREAKILVDWVPVCKIVCHAKDKSEVLCDNAAVKHFKLDKEKIVAAYNLATGSDEGVLWGP